MYVVCFWHMELVWLELETSFENSCVKFMKLQPATNAWRKKKLAPDSLVCQM